MAYVGQTKSARLLAELQQRGIGEATQPKEFPPRRTPYFLDNGAFADWTNARPFSERAFFLAAERAGTEGPLPDFIVAPDRVADPDSLSMSMRWVPRLRDFAPLALVVQDGMEEEDVRKAMRRGGFDVLFVGGTLRWKFDTLPLWVRVAHDMGKRVHCGRMGTAPRVAYARQCGVDSVDSCTPLWSSGNMRRFLGALDAPVQQAIGDPAPPPARESSWTKAADRRLDLEQRVDENMDFWR